MLGVNLRPYADFVTAVENLAGAGFDDQKLLNIVPFKRWVCLSPWLQDLAVRMTYSAAELEPHQREDILVRQVWAINAYSRYHGAHVSIPTVNKPLYPLYPAYAAQDLAEAFPLLPFSQKYTEVAYRQAVGVLFDFIVDQCRAHELPLDLEGRRTGEAMAGRYARLGLDARHVLSLNIWNTFVLALMYNEFQPNVELLFSSTELYKRPSRGGASALPSSAFQASSPFPSTTGNSDLDDAFFHAVFKAVVSQAVEHGTIAPARSLPVLGALNVGLRQAAGQRHRSSLIHEWRQALLEEFRALWAQIPSLAEDPVHKMPEPPQIFECVNPTVTY
ncbi:hypothetical protein JCM11641_003564 [Rhodosporidiobolus odoratus]